MHCIVKLLKVQRYWLDLTIRLLDKDWGVPPDEGFSQEGT